MLTDSSLFPYGLNRGDIRPDLSILQPVRQAITRVHLFARAISSAALLVSAAIREPYHLAGRFLLWLANKTGKQLCPTGVVKPVPSTCNEHSLLFTVHPAPCAAPDDVPTDVHDCVCAG